VLERDIDLQRSEGGREKRQRTGRRGREKYFEFVFYVWKREIRVEIEMHHMSSSFFLSFFIFNFEFNKYTHDFFLF
jgi:hypothetical protein